MEQIGENKTYQFLTTVERQLINTNKSNALHRTNNKTNADHVFRVVGLNPR